MSLIIHTKNNFLRIAFSALYDELCTSENICIIDLTSFFSLKELQQALKENLKLINCRVILLGGKNICSKILYPLRAHSLNSSVNILKKSMLGGYKLSVVIGRINECRMLKKLTKGERLLAQALCWDISVKNIAKALGVSEKIVYSQTSNAAMKLNLTTGREFIFFIHREFSSGIRI